MDHKQQHKRDLLRRWISGEITASEERELRQAARDDTLLNDALAGYEQQAEADHMASIGRLRSKISGQRKAKARTLPIWRVAAAVLVIGALGWLMFPSASQNDMALSENRAERQEKSTDALAETRPSSSPAVPAQPSFPASEQQVTTAERSEASNNANFPGNVQAQPEVLAETNFPTDSFADAADFTLAMESEPFSAGADAPITEAPSEMMAVQDDTEELTAIAPSAAPPPPTPDVIPTYTDGASQVGYPNRLDRSVTTNSGQILAREGFRVIRGYVVDSEGYPLIGATVLEEGTANGTITDFDGFYRLTIPSSGATLSANYTGYEDQVVAVTADEELTITLQEGIALDEVVVTELGQERRQKRATNAGTAEPEGGFRALKRYIDYRTPVNTPRTRIRLQFVVDTSGRPSNIQVLSSSNVALNNFAIELLQNGPIWEITEGDAPLRMVYTMKLKG
ncbi:MAG: carboxypeptidase-like regulatory domain-containing protein [Bacteroidota bacterium]